MSKLNQYKKSEISQKKEAAEPHEIIHELLSQLNKNLSDARCELDFTKRKKAYQNAQKTLWEESGTMIPYHVSKLVVTSSRVKNLDEVEVFSVRWHKIQVN